jgi:hypothetical protein
MQHSKVVVLAVAVSIATWACASSPTSTGEQGSNLDDGPSSPSSTSGAPKSPTPSSSNSAGNGSTTTPSAVPPPTTQLDAGADGGDDDDDACSAACAQQNPAGAKTYDDLQAALTACQCAASVCGTQCGQTSACTDDGPDPQEGDACSTCLAGSPAAQCEAQQESSCKADAQCAAASACIDKCGDDDDDDDNGATPPATTP